MTRFTFLSSSACLILVAMFPGSSDIEAQASAPASKLVWVGRLVGVFDDVTGAPLIGAEVFDIQTGNSALTTSTGTVVLSFVDTTRSMLRIRKFGYIPQVIEVANSSRDSVPPTITLVRIAAELPTQVTSASRSPADTVRKLQLAGYYDRRMASGAPFSAFATGKELERLLYLSDVKYLSGRGICTGNLYINGAKVGGGRTTTPAGPKGTPGPAAPNILNSITVQEVLAIELYSHVAEFPAEYNSTQAAGAGGCLTLIWTK